MINLNNLVFHRNSASADPETIRLGIAIDILKQFPGEMSEKSELSPEKIASRIGHLALLLNEGSVRPREIEKNKR